MSMQLATVLQHGIRSADAGHWGRSATWYETFIARHGAHASTLHHLALACWQLARHGAARQYWREACVLAPDATLYSDMLRRLDIWTRACDCDLGPALLRAGHLLATPLGPHHSCAAHAIADAGLRRDVGLPFFRTPADFRAWVVWQRTACATMVHALVDPDEHGFIGAVTLAADGCFSYWIAASQRRRGYGGLILQLLEQLAAARGVTRLHSRVLLDNAASCSALDAGGFRCTDNGLLHLLYSKDLTLS